MVCLLQRVPFTSHEMEIGMMWETVNSDCSQAPAGISVRGWKGLSAAGRVCPRLEGSDRGWKGLTAAGRV